MTQEKDNFTGKDRNLIPEELRQEWEALIISGDVKHTDYRILMLLLANPSMTSKAIADQLSMHPATVTRRLNSPGFLKARVLFEGTVSDQMHEATRKFAKWINRTLDTADYAEDQRLVLEAGKVAVGFMAKEAELTLKNREVEVKERTVPMSPLDAKRVLEADVSNKADVPVVIPELDAE